jgi:glucarate dehydratase
VPIYELLGGTVRTDVPFTEYFAFRHPSAHGAGEATPVEVAQYCARMREEHGSTVFEGKVGSTSLSTDIEMVKEIRAAVGDDALIRLDANHGWPLNTARKALRELARYDIANIEDPYSDYWGMAQLRTHSSIPFSSHVPDIRLAAHLRVPDTIVLNLSGLGGIRETLKFISACELMDIGFWFYSADAGIGTAAYIQVVAAMPYLDEPSQSLCRWYLTDVIEGGPLAPENGVVPIPSGPGLGISLDRTALRECSERFQRDGPIPFMYEQGEHYWRLNRQAPPSPQWNESEWAGAANNEEAT